VSIALGAKGDETLLTSACSENVYLSPQVRTVLAELPRLVEDRHLPCRSCLPRYARRDNTVRPRDAQRGDGADKRLAAAPGGRPPGARCSSPCSADNTGTGGPRGGSHFGTTSARSAILEGVWAGTALAGGGNFVSGDLGDRNVRTSRVPRVGASSPCPSYESSRIHAYRSAIGADGLPGQDSSR
jgi:hypothetical protein